MSRKFGKRKEENEYASEGDNPPKKSSRTDDSDDDDGIVVCEISKNRRVSVRSFGGRIMVDIREFYLKEGKQMPGRKEEMSRKFGKRKEENEYASEGDNPPKKSSRTDDSDDDDGIVVCEISKNRRVSVRSFGGRIMVDIREFYLKEGKQMPGRKGISLSMDQWNVLRDHADEIDEAVSENS